MKNFTKKLLAILAVIFIITALTVPAFASEANAETTAVTETAEQEESGESGGNSVKVIGAAAVLGLVAAVGAVCMAIAIKGASDGMARQPEASGNIRTAMMLGLVFIETAIIYALIVSILIIFVL